MWRPYQPNPQGIDTGDCPVRAVCAVTGLPWRAVHDILCALSGEMADMPNKNRVWWAFLRGMGFRQLILPNLCPDCYTVAEFAADHPKGRFVLGPYQHAVAVIDGNWWDSWDSGKTVPMYYFEYRGDRNGVQPADVLPAELSADAVPDVSADAPGARDTNGPCKSAADNASDDDAADDPRGDRAGG